MMETFEDRLTEARSRGFGAGALQLLRTSADLVLSGFLARRAERTSPSPRTSERHRPERDGVMFDSLKQDLVFAIRSIRRNPTFSVAALVTLALGVGATTSIFSVVNGVLLRPLPYPGQERLVSVYATSVQEPEGRGSMSRPDIRDLADLPALETLVGYASGGATLTGLGDARIVPGARVTQGILSTFGLRPFMGRDLLPEETVPGSTRAAVVAYGFWKEDLGGVSDVLGRTLQIQGDTYEIVGVAPPGFDFPQGSRIWRPYYTSDDECGRGCHVYDALGRLADGASTEEALEQAKVLALRLEDAFPRSNFETRFRILSLEDDVVGDIRPQLWTLLAAVGLVLLVACANVANLLLARTQSRLGEVGIRVALGAGRSRLLRQVLAESLILAFAGGVAGLGLAFLGVRTLKDLAPASLPRVEEISLDGSVLLFALLLSFTVALVFGLRPALRLARTSPADALGGSRRGGDAGRAGSRSRSLLLASEVAFSLILLVGAGLLLRTLGRLQHVEPGYRTHGIVRFVLSLPESGYPELNQIARFYETLEERLRALPGVESAGSSFGAPLGSMRAAGSVAVEGRPEPEPGAETSAEMRPITPGYLETMGVPVLRGRSIEPGDRSGTMEVALVNAALAESVFPGEDPIGQRMRVSVDFDYGSPYRTIVGIVGNERTISLTQAPTLAFYVPQKQAGPPFMTVLVRYHPGAGPLLDAIRQEVAALDPQVPLRGVETMEQVMAEQTAPTRFFLTLLAVFAGLAVSLAAVGLYGVVSYMVSRRHQEIGIRMALGAPGPRVTRMVLAQAAVPTAGGLLVGLGVSLAGARILERFLFQVDPRDPLVFSAVPAILVAVAFIATLLPARQASRVDPGEALRKE